MNQKIILCMFLLASSAHAAINPPTSSSVSDAIVSCYGERIELDATKSSDLVSFLSNVKDGWVSWGFITHPAGDIDITLSLKDKNEFWFFTWRDLRLMGTYGEKRSLSVIESQQLKQLLPPKCFEPQSPNTALQLTPKPLRAFGATELGR
jgi:hypothetical protein